MNSKIYQLLCDIKEILTDIFQSGFFSVHDHDIQKIQDLSSLSAQYGLSFAEKNLLSLAHILKRQRHIIQKDDEQAIPIFCSLLQYTNICLKKMEYDTIKNHVKNKKDEI